jgi:hypothetical protein
MIGIYQLMNVPRLKNHLSITLLTGITAIPVMIHAQPDTLWTRKYGGVRYETGYSGMQTSDSGFVVTGTRESDSGIHDLSLIKMNANGDSIWTRTYSGGIGFSVIQGHDGDYLIAGESAEGNSVDVVVIKADNNGHTSWMKTYGGVGRDVGSRIRPTSSETGYVITGFTTSSGFGGIDVWIARIDLEGDTLWIRAYGGDRDDWGSDILETNDGGILILGATRSFGAGSADIWLIQTDASGDTVWTRTYGGDGIETGDVILPTGDDEFLIVGSTSTYGAGLMDLWLLKIDMQGDTVWTRTYGGHRTDECRSGAVTIDGGYIFAGFTDSRGAGGFDSWIIRTDSEGNILWDIVIGGEEGDYCHSVVQTMDTGYLITGGTSSNSVGSSDMWLVRLGPDIPVTAVIKSVYPSKISLVQNYPNPFNPATTIRYELPHASEVSLIVYDLVGREVVRLVDGYMEPGYHEVQWNGRDSASGIYIARLVTLEYSKAIKMVLLK